MRIDQATAADLGVTPQAGEASLLGDIDHSWTRAGHARLRERLTIPLGDAIEIRQRQEALRLIAPLADLLALTPWATLTEAVRSYLDSSYVPLPRTTAELWFVRRRYPDMTRHLVRGVRAAAAFVRAATDAARQVDVLGVHSPVLDALAVRLHAAAEDPALTQIHSRSGTGGSDASYARLDAVVRGPGRGSIEATLDAVSELDALQSMARASMRSGWCFPEVVDGDAIEVAITALRHPLVADCVANDVRLDDARRVLFITGPNMAGKTTLLRACGLATLLAHCGMALPAFSARISVFDRLFAALTVRDSIARGESFFLAEVRRVGALVEHASRERVFAVVDEMFKGTNVLDAMDATELVTRGLSRADGCVFLVASHLTELADALGQGGAVHLQQMEVVMESAGPRSTFRLGDGVSRQRLGMHLLAREGVVAAIEKLVALSTHERGQLSQ